MREELWQSFVKKYPDTEANKDAYLKSEQFSDVNLLTAWYNAKKLGSETFNYNSQVFRTDDGFGVENQNV